MNERQRRINQALNKIQERIGKTSNRAIARELGVSHTTVLGWLAGREPEGDHLKILSQKSGYSVDYLLSGQSNDVSVNDLVQVISRAHNIETLLSIQNNLTQAIGQRVRELSGEYKPS